MTVISTDIKKEGKGVVGYEIANPNQTVELAEGVTISAADDPAIAGDESSYGIQGLATSTGGSLVLNGAVHSESSAGLFSAADNYSVQIGPNGTVSGGTDGIVLSASVSGVGGNAVVNWGLITGATSIGIWASYSNNLITNHGKVEAPTGIVAGSAGSGNNKVVNGASGSIVSYGGFFSMKGSAVTLHGAGSSLENGGLIRTDSFNAAVRLVSLEGETQKIFNTGIIESSSGKQDLTVQGGEGSDQVFNQKTIIGGVLLGSGNDLYDGRSGTIINGLVDLGSGNDAAYGGSGNETVNGGAGNDYLSGSAGADVLNPLEFLSASDRDTVDGGTGIDTLSFGMEFVNKELNLLKFPVDATVDLRSTKLQNVGKNWGSVKLTGIENITTLQGKDLLIGDSRANAFLSGAGDDTLEGGLGNDVLDGEGGFDFARFTGSTGAKVSLATTKAQSTGYGTDTLRNIEGLTGGSGADRFTGNSQDNRFYGNAGHDSVWGGNGHDTLVGGSGNDRLTGGSGKDVFVLNAKLSAVSNVDRITDFLRKDDTIQLENAIFRKLTKTGVLNKN